MTTTGVLRYANAQVTLVPIVTNLKHTSSYLKFKWHKLCCPQG